MDENRQNNGRRQMDSLHEINSECVKRTADALAEGHRLAVDLERKLLENVTAVSNRIDVLDKDLAVLTQSVSGPSGFLAVLNGIKNTLQVMVDNLSNMNSRLAVIESNESNQKIAREPWQKMGFGLLEKLIWAAAAFGLGYLTLK
jgi:hypothetical protein